MTLWWCYQTCCGKSWFTRWLKRTEGSWWFKLQTYKVIKTWLAFRSWLGMTVQRKRSENQEPSSNQENKCNTKGWHGVYEFFFLSFTARCWWYLLLIWFCLRIGQGNPPLDGPWDPHIILSWLIPLIHKIYHKIYHELSIHIPKIVHLFLPKISPSYLLHILHHYFYWLDTYFLMAVVYPH